ncbi:DUF6221 family protein [Streptomyces sp. NPDC008222]|uniref:DUF6221 family protein n=1 Tax=Streptomyces sp. NPDC008222 TaxID=3364820 RepID=UPI0036E04C91
MMSTDQMVAWLRQAMGTAQWDAETAARETEPEWSDGGPYGEGVHTQRHGSPVAVGPWGYMDDAVRTHIARHDPTAVLRRITKDRELLDDILAEKHHISDDPWYTCPAATRERDGGTYAETEGGGQCSCGRDERAQRRIRTLAEGYGWTEK